MLELFNGFEVPNMAIMNTYHKMYLRVLGADRNV
jgi:hypothetical protein